MNESARVRCPTVPGTVDAENPWPGLAAFREADQAFFKGREAVVEELERLVSRAPVTVLFGVSGLGKTSLLRAGLFPMLRQNGMLPVYIRLQHGEGGRGLREQVFDALAHATGAAGVESVEPHAGASLWEHLHRKDVRFWNERNRMVTPILVFDQFEEIFTLGGANPERRERSEAFLVELADLVEARPPAEVKARLEHEPEEALRFTLADRPCKVLVSLREDFLADVTAFAARMPSIAQHTYRLQRMNQDEALRVVQVEGLVPPEVARRVVDFVAAPDEAGAAPFEALPVEPALLSVFCRELNHKRRAQGRATIAADLVEGNARTIIADFYERTISDKRLGPGVRRLVEEKLLTRSGFRNSLAEEEAVLEPGVTSADIDRLIELRLLRRDETGTRGHTRIELTHDVLTEPIRASRDRRRVREQEERKLAALRAVELEARKRADEERRRRFTVLLGIASGVAMLLALVAVYQRGQAEQQRAEARRALAAADVERVLLGDPEPLPYLARAVANDPANDLPRAVLFAQLSSAMIPVAAMRPAETSRKAIFVGAGRDVATLGENGGLHFWAWEGDRYAAESAPPVFPVRAPIVQLQLGPDGTSAAMVTENGVHFSSLGSPLELLPPGELISAMQFSRDGSRLLALADARLHAWDAPNGSRLALRIDGFQNVVAAGFGDDGTILAVTAGPRMRVWNAATGAAVSPEEAPLTYENVVPGVFAVSGHVLALVSRGNRVRLWDVTTGQPLGATMRHDRPVTHCAFSPDGSRLLTASDEAVRLWDAATGDPLGWPVRHHAPITSASFSRDAAFIITASDDGLVKVWDARRAVAASTPVPHPERAGVSRMVFSPDGASLLTVAIDGVARLWDASSGTLRAALAQQDAGTGEILDHIDDAVFSGDGTRIVTKGTRSVRLWDATGRPAPGMAPMALPADGPASWIVVAGLSRDGGAVVTVADDGTTTLWSAQSGRAERSFAATLAPSSEQGPANVRLGALSSAAMVLAAATERQVTLWDLTTGAHMGEPMAHRQTVTWIDFHPAGTHLVTGSLDRTARLWNARTGALVGELYHDGPVRRAVFSDSGEEVVTTTTDSGSVRLWDVRGALDEDPTTLDRAVTLTVDDVWVAEISHGRVFTGTMDGRVLAWSARTGASIGPPLRHDPRLASMAVSRDGSRLATVAGTDAYFDSGEPLARIWDVPVGDAADGDMLRQLATAVGGHRLEGDGVLADLSEQEARVALEQVQTRWGQGDDLAGRFVRWFLANPSDRTVSPLSTVVAGTESDAGGAFAPRAKGTR